MTNRLRLIAVTAGLAGACGLAAGLAASKAVYPPLEVLFTGGETAIAQPIRYPTGTPEVTAAIVTMQPGQSTGWHRHDTPLFAWMIEGELTVDYGADGTRTYVKGDAFLEAFRTAHNGTNSGPEIARVLAVFMGAEGTENTVVEGR